MKNMTIETEKSSQELKIKPKKENIFFKFFRFSRKFGILVSEGATIKDKLAIILYTPKTFSHLISYDYNSHFLWDVTLKNKDGIFFCGKNNIAVFTGSTLDEIKLRDYFKLDEGVFVDIGSNIGKYAVKIGRKLSGGKGRVIALEPEPYNFEILKKNIKLNNLDNVLPLQLACYSENKKLTFYVEKSGSGSHSIYPTNSASKTIIIDALKLDDILKKNKIERVDLIKIDVEGAEVNVFQGAMNTIKKYHPQIIFECFSEDNLNKIEKILDKFNYHIKELPQGKNYLAY